MTKEEFVDTVSKLPGVGSKKAEALFDAGFTTLEQLKAASKADLEAVEGIGPKVADAIIAGLADDQAASQEIQVVEEKGAKPAKTEIVEAERVYQVKIKPELSEELKAALAIREDRSSREPRFKHYYWWLSPKIPDAWRAPKGTLSKQRRGMGYRPPRVKVGYGKPAATRHLHPTGFEEVMVFNVADMDGIDAKTQAARIGGTVGKKKRRDILERAKEMSVRVLNPGVL